MKNNLIDQFIKLICEDLTLTELRAAKFDYKKIRNLPGFPKKERIKDLNLCLIAPSMILIKGDSDILLTIKHDGSDLFIECWEMVDPIFLPSFDDDDAVEYFIECCIDKVFPEDVLS